MTTNQQPSAALYVTSNGNLFIDCGNDHQLRRRRLVCELGDMDVIAKISALEAEVSTSSEKE